MKIIKKILVGVMLVMAFTSTTALAAGDACSFIFQSSKGYGNLNVNWKVTDKDTAWADTSHKSTDYVTTTYLESNKSDSIESKFNYGYTYSTATISRNTTRFNSSHGMSNASNVYDTLVSSQCTDW